MVSQLKQSLDQLDRRNELIRISKAVDPRFEASAIIKRIQQVSNKAILFEKIKGYDLPLASNILGTYQRVAKVLGCDVDGINRPGTGKKKHSNSFAPIWRQQIRMTTLKAPSMKSRP